MGQHEMIKFEFDLLAHTELMADMIRNRIVVTTDSIQDYEQAYGILCDSTRVGMFYIRHVKEGVDHVYFTNSQDRTSFIDSINYAE